MYGRSACHMAWADLNRSRGRFLRAFMSTRSSPSGASGRKARKRDRGVLQDHLVGVGPPGIEAQEGVLLGQQVKQGTSPRSRCRRAR